MSKINRNWLPKRQRLKNPSDLTVGTHYTYVARDDDDNEAALSVAWKPSR